ncbi:MAG: monovalent cation/H(+) antiporter subunit G [Candidatus Subteraquimicrobiales bacterium]|nr:monovalent cation/H(+) antiporter subunit G [Candidatus Subteraquimicrobiales bacterium]
MIEVIINSIVIILCCISIFFFIVGTIGLFRLPDVYSRLHAATKCDTLGGGSVLIALAVYERLSFNSFKLFVIAFLLLITSSTTGHAIARAAYKAGQKPWQKKELVFPKEE